MTTSRPTVITTFRPRPGSVPAPFLVARSYEAYRDLVLARSGK